MTTADLERFFRRYYRERILELARGYPEEGRALVVEWDDLYQFDPDLADDLRANPKRVLGDAREALRTFDVPVDVDLDEAEVYIAGFPTQTPIRDIRAEHVNTLVSVRGIVRKATPVRPKVEVAVYECLTCGGQIEVVQRGQELREPNRCHHCERNTQLDRLDDRSRFVDAQRLRIQESPEGLRGGDTPQNIDVHLETDLTGIVSPGDRVSATGILRLREQTRGNTTSPILDVFLEGNFIDLEEEEFEVMAIEDEDVDEIRELAAQEDIYERVVDSIAPSIWGYEDEKLAMALQLFSGVRKPLPDGSRVRGDIHVLLVGDPGTGKCVSGDTLVRLGDGSTVEIETLVEEHLEEPTSVDDGVYDDIDVTVPSMTDTGQLRDRRAVRVWKRSVSEYLLRIETDDGQSVKVTPSHPLYLEGEIPVRAEHLEVGDRIAVAHDQGPTAEVVSDGGTTTMPSSGTTPPEIRLAAIGSIDRVEPDSDWVYDLEVSGTHNYLTNGIVSHNSQLLQYITKIAPRSVYTSGKGSSAAGLCVTGDTLIHTDEGFRNIEDIVTEELPDPVDTETPATAQTQVYSYDRVAGSIRSKETNRVWRMPEKPCRRIETAKGKSIEASVNTPILTWGDTGLEWRRVADIKSGDPVAVPRYFDVKRSTPPVHEYLEFTSEKLKLSHTSVSFLRHRLDEAFGSLRNAAAALDLSEDDVYSTLPKRYIPLNKLERILEAINLEIGDVEIDRAMVRHGSSVRIPDTFDEELMYLVGLVFGDGDVSVSPNQQNRGRVRISNSNESILTRAKNIIKNKFDVDVVIEHQDDRVPCIRLHSVTVARWFSNLGVESPKVDLELAYQLTTSEHADAFLRGLFDADGSVCERDNGGSSIQLSTICPDFARQLQLMLETYGIRARLRTRKPPEPASLENGNVIEAQSTRHELLIYGKDIDTFENRIGFEVEPKVAALSRVANSVERRGEILPIGETLARTDGGTPGAFHNTLVRGSNPTKATARRLLREADLGELEPAVREVVGDGIAWDEVVTAKDIGEREVFDLTVPISHNFVGNGIITHNTAAAIRDDFGDGQQWTLEAGALVLADQGVAAVDELDKMRCVTGDTEVHLADGERMTIAEMNKIAERSGDSEHLPNGRTIRNTEFEVRTMARAGRIVTRPVAAIHRYDPPSELVEVRLTNEEYLRSTRDHPYFVEGPSGVVERPAESIKPDDRVIVPEYHCRYRSDGGLMERPQAVNSLGGTTSCAVESVETYPNESQQSVYDLTVEETENFVANGMVVHNSEDRSAMHEALEQQSVSVSKAGINATLQARCALLGAANPKYGRFDQYEPIPEQIELEPALISRFDLIFTVDDLPDVERDERIAEHILQTNYAGELNSRRVAKPGEGGLVQKVEEATEEVTPTIEPELLRKYVAYATQTCIPTMTMEAREAIKSFYLDLRKQGVDEDSPVPMTARKLEALVRLAEASARIRLADEVTEEDAERVIELVRASMGDIGFDPETGAYDVDMIETGTPKTQRDRIKSLKQLMEALEEEHDDGIPLDVLIEEAEERGMDADRIEHEISKMKQSGEIYEPSSNRYRLA